MMVIFATCILQMKRIVLLLISPLLLSGFTLPEGDEPSSRDILEKMIYTALNLKTIRYEMRISERVNGKMLDAGSQVKLNVSPRKIYLKIPKLGAELLWVAGTNNGDALVNPNAFPYINLNLDPYGYFLRKDQHHTINELGFTYMAGVLAGSMKLVGPEFDQYCSFVNEKWNGHDCYKVTIDNTDFKYYTYVAKEGETITTIARKLFVSEFMLVGKNPGTDYYSKLKAGKKILVPTAYSRKMVMFIDKQLSLPVNIKIYDDAGLFESYEYISIQVNPKFADEEFTADYKDYNF
jgi:outer membrane lipoprotein-sorting protein